AFEIAEQRSWSAPDAILCPVGAGSILLGLWRGFTELQKAGLVERLPRLFAAQSDRVCPVYLAYTRGDHDVQAGDPHGTLAGGSALRRPVRGREVLRALRETRGGAVRVSDDEIRRGLLALGRHGVAVEPTSAVVLPTLDRLCGDRAILDTAEVVLVLSGSA